jgi:hypothetical protein
MLIACNVQKTELPSTTRYFVFILNNQQHTFLFIQ